MPQKKAKVSPPEPLRSAADEPPPLIIADVSGDEAAEIEFQSFGSFKGSQSRYGAEDQFRDPDVDDDDDDDDE